MKADYKRRELMKVHNVTLLRLNAMVKNTILPREIQADARKHIQALPVNSFKSHLTDRCAVTGRGRRGNVDKFRLSRFVFRHLMDYNKISGGQRAMWSFSPPKK